MLSRNAANDYFSGFIALEAGVVEQAVPLECPVKQSANAPYQHIIQIYQALRKDSGNLYI